ncbi:hypothetical protein JB92DRAFT_2828388 [Gautieria morchelliformis]|nr:hypothetical protein JB92DRAFT_2828388 [Gautieria morchelliformis]
MLTRGSSGCGSNAAYLGFMECGLFFFMDCLFSSRTPVLLEAQRKPLTATGGIASSPLICSQVYKARELVLIRRTWAVFAEHWGLLDIPRPVLEATNCIPIRFPGPIGAVDFILLMLLESDYQLTGLHHGHRGLNPAQFQVIPLSPIQSKDGALPLQL